MNVLRLLVNVQLSHVVDNELLLANKMLSLIVNPFSTVTSSDNNELIIGKGSTITE